MPYLSPHLCPAPHSVPSLRENTGRQATPTLAEPEILDPELVSLHAQAGLGLAWTQMGGSNATLLHTRQ